MATAAYVVTIRDPSGDPVNVFGICAEHGPNNLFVKQAIALANGQSWRRIEGIGGHVYGGRAGRFSVQQVEPGLTNWTCEICAVASCDDLL